jgi:Flp pilus assembly protein TadG
MKTRLESGAAAIEFALTFLLLWLLMAGTFRLGYGMYVYESLVSALAGAGRYAARVEFDSPDHQFIGRIQRLVVYGAPTGGTDPVAPGLTPSHVSVTWSADEKGVPRTITVTIVNYTVNALFQSFTWSGKPYVSVRFAGRLTT